MYIYVQMHAYMHDVYVRMCVYKYVCIFISSKTRVLCIRLRNAQSINPADMCGTETRKYVL